MSQRRHAHAPDAKEREGIRKRVCEKKKEVKGKAWIAFTSYAAPDEGTCTARANSRHAVDTSGERRATTRSKALVKARGVCVAPTAILFQYWQKEGPRIERQQSEQGRKETGAGEERAHN